MDRNVLTWYKCKLREHKAVTSTGYGRDIHVSWVTAITVYKKIVDEVRENIRLAVIGRGPYRLSPEAQLASPNVTTRME